MKRGGGIKGILLVISCSAVLVFLFLSVKTNASFFLTFLNKPAPPVIIVDHHKETILAWMYEISDEPMVTLERIYDKVYSSPLGDLKLAIIFCEASPKFNPKSKSSAGAMGLMQVLPSVWTETLIEEGIIGDKRELWLPEKNIDAGEFILNYYLSETGNLEEALYKYVGGDKKYIKDVFSALGKIYILKQTATNKGEDDIDDRREDDSEEGILESSEAEKKT